MAQGTKWKIERWLVELYPGNGGEKLEAYEALRPRELAIVAAAVLDAALADLLSRRLSGREEEIVSFLGANEDGRAPCGSFGARIQLALLLQLITDADARRLRALKNIRNTLAHRARASFADPRVHGLLRELLPITADKAPKGIEWTDLYKVFNDLLKEDPTSGGRDVLLLFFMTMQTRLADRVTQLVSIAELEVEFLRAELRRMQARERRRQRK